MTRRDFMALSAAVPLLPLVSFSSQEQNVSSALASGKPKPLKYEEIKGFLSRAQIAPHHTAHYGGALKSLLQIETELEGVDRSKANPNYSTVRELKREQIHAMNSVLLHELYFDGLTPSTGDPGEAAQDVFKKRFGSLEKWLDDFKAAAVSARGWAILSYHPANSRFYNIVTDAHDAGLIVMGIPLVVIDCYEHAFYVDYKNKKGDYVAAYPKFIDWPEIDRRIKAVK